MRRRFGLACRTVLRRRRSRMDVLFSGAEEHIRGSLDQQVERGLSITDQEGDHVIDEDIFACTPVASITTTKIR